MSKSTGMGEKSDEKLLEEAPVIWRVKKEVRTKPIRPDPGCRRNRSGSGVCKFRSYRETRIGRLQRDYDFRGMPVSIVFYARYIPRYGVRDRL